VDLGALLPGRGVGLADELVVLTRPQADAVDRDADGREEGELASGGPEGVQAGLDRARRVTLDRVGVDRLRERAAATGGRHGLEAHERVDEVGVSADLARERTLFGEGGLDPGDSLLA